MYERERVCVVDKMAHLGEAHPLSAQFYVTDASSSYDPFFLSII